MVIASLKAELSIRRLFKRTEPTDQTAVNRVLRDYMLANRKAG